ncbi:hypothetical protein A2930_00935 [Candidatus Giovannonibacteria bacterium RIFCSPLOWO2_01_FULL_45_34]|uniref:Uncharacterized protein n=1 Tax=Candidatus Giovannonibacteria bacterium RIFCSPLOWO2_01_FULL_45_34 TaxID=1798351 RepID=A0A1F5WY42_9BACT|nr:MAG: hypothetical protein A2930_00935 [Candidatus Giovannonibacteria bacterium RIFCSPLOWO2_01_FULL_45_34]
MNKYIHNWQTECRKSNITQDFFNWVICPHNSRIFLYQIIAGLTPFVNMSWRKKIKIPLLSGVLML